MTQSLKLVVNCKRIAHLEEIRTQHFQTASSAKINIKIREKINPKFHLNLQNIIKQMVPCDNTATAEEVSLDW